MKRSLPGTGNSHNKNTPKHNHETNDLSIGTISNLLSICYLILVPYHSLTYVTLAERAFGSRGAMLVSIR